MQVVPVKWAKDGIPTILFLPNLYRSTDGPTCGSQPSKPVYQQQVPSHQGLRPCALNLTPLEVRAHMQGHGYGAYSLNTVLKDPRQFLDIQGWLHATGIEHQPGPFTARVGLIANAIFNGARFGHPTNGTQGGTDHTRRPCQHKATPYLLEVCNITSLTSHVSDVAGRAGQAFLFQEHSCPPAQLKEYTQLIRKRRKKVILGPLDPESRHNLGGVGAIVNQGQSLIRLKPITTELQQATQSGRCDLYCLDVGCATAVYAFNIYGYTGGCTDKRQARRTSAILDACRKELEHLPDGPAIIVGDLNAEPCKITSARELLQDDWIDLGASAYILGKPTAEFTCVAPNTTAPTRRDYVFANAAAMAIISDFNVVHQHDFPVHSLLQVQFTPTAHARYLTKGNSPLSFSTFLDKRVKELSGNLFTDKEKADLRNAQLSLFHQHLDGLFQDHAELLQMLLDQKLTTDFWEAWNGIVEHAFCEAYRIDVKDRHSYQGRGKLKLRKVKISRPAFQGQEEEGYVDDPNDLKEIQRLQRQATRCSQWAARLRILQKPGHLPPDKQATLQKLNEDARRLILRDGSQTSEYELNFANQVSDIIGDHPMHIIKLKLHAERIAKTLDDKRAAYRKNLVRLHEASYDGDSYHKRAY